MNRAQSYCEGAVKAGTLTRHIDVLHPQDGSVLVSAEREDLLPDHITAWATFRGVREEQMFSVWALEKRTYYTIRGGRSHA